VALERAGKTVKLYLIGKKGYDQLNRLYADNIVEYVSLKEERKLHAGIAQGIGEKVTAMFTAGEFDVAKLIYSKFVNVMQQDATAETLIPAIAALGTEDDAPGKHAARNAGDMIDKLTMTFNRTRQAQITSELIEIISGAEAL